MLVKKNKSRNHSQVSYFNKEHHRFFNNENDDNYDINTSKNKKRTWESNMLILQSKL